MMKYRIKLTYKSGLIDEYVVEHFKMQTFSGTIYLNYDSSEKLIVRSLKNVVRLQIGSFIVSSDNFKTLHSFVPLERGKKADTNQSGIKEK